MPFVERQPRFRLSLRIWLGSFLVLLFACGGLWYISTRALGRTRDSHRKFRLKHAVDTTLEPLQELRRALGLETTLPPRGTLDRISPGADAAWILDRDEQTVLDAWGSHLCPDPLGWPDDLPSRALLLGSAEGRVQCGGGTGREMDAKALRMEGEGNRPIGVLVTAVDAGPSSRMGARAFRSQALSTLAILAGGAWLLMLVSRRLTRPLPELMEGSRRIALGDFDHRVEIRRRDELGLLGLTLNDAAASLKLGRRRLRQAGRIQAWHQVARQVAHEIKNPLTGMRAAAENLSRATDRDQEVLREAARECADVVGEEVAALSRLADAFSSLSKLPDPTPEDADLNQLVLHALSLLSSSRPELPLEVLTDLEADLPLVHVDETQIGQVLKNLLKNAEEALPRGGRILVATRRTGGEAEVRVEDSGAGVPEADRDRVFEPFVTTKATGSGIGLSLSRQIAEAHGGSLTWTESSLGGAAFRLTLPLDTMETESSGRNPSRKPTT